MKSLPTTIVEIDQLIADDVQEDIHLDYKESPAIDKAKRYEIAKDVSAFANSDGGILIYGIIENNNLPAGKDSGVDHTKYSREWLEQIISSNITPRIDGIRIAPIPVSADRSIYAVEIPKSFRAPHQAPDKKYYKRFNFQSVPMEDYEINDVRSRQRSVAPLVNIDIETKRGNLVYLVVTNIGKVPAQDVTFAFSKEIKWRGNRGTPTLFKRGIKYFPPARTFNFFYNSFIGAFDKENEIPSNFEIEVKYFHPDINRRITDTFYVDLMDYMDTYIVESELADLGKKIQEGFKGLKDELSKTNNHLSIISSISGATGLDISIPTLKNLGHILKGDGKIEKIDPNGRRAEAFKELLGVDDNLAYTLQCHFMSIGRVRLEEIEGMTQELIQKFKELFFIDDSEDT
jgi:hypothetical protein